MIKNNRPYSIENGYEDAALITDLPCYAIEEVMEWIRNNIVPAKDESRRSSYGLKHNLEHDTGIYLTNNQFKDAMLLSGYRPLNEHEINWTYNITYLKDAWWNPSPFVAYVLREHIDEESPEGDFARDIKGDADFPKVADHNTIQSYLEGLHACPCALEVFEGLWDDFDVAGFSVVPTAPASRYGV